eukprot:9867443-Karenia_brevis.AAC.1
MNHSKACRERVERLIRNSPRQEDQVEADPEHAAQPSTCGLGRDQLHRDDMSRDEGMPGERPAKQFRRTAPIQQASKRSTEDQADGTDMKRARMEDQVCDQGAASSSKQPRGSADQLQHGSDPRGPGGDADDLGADIDPD